MNLLLNFVHRLAAGGWVGVMLGVSLLVPPVVFGNLPRREAGEVMGRIFSAYYLLGIALGILALLALVLLALRTGWGRERVAAAVMLAVMLGASGYLRMGLVPQVFAARDRMYTLEDAAAPEGVAARARMGRLHALSEGINGTVLLCGIGVLLLGAIRESRLERGTLRDPRSEQGGA
ncbi:MAG: DUF4149 domain-containing protein [Nitrospirota bacterium]|nr:DUF4149 domain-containing protein [Nitrospirota bacterium]